MNESENNHVSGENPQGNNLNQSQWTAGYPMPWPGYPTPPQAPTHSDAQNYPPQGQGYFPWMPFPPYWMQPGFPPQPGTSSAPGNTSESMASQRAATAPSEPPVPSYPMPWAYPYPPNMMMWGYPGTQEHTAQGQTQDESASDEANAEDVTSGVYSNFRIQEESNPEAPAAVPENAAISTYEEENSSDTEDGAAEIVQEEPTVSESDADQEPEEDAELESDELAPAFTIVSQSEPEDDESDSDLTTSANSDASTESETASIADTSTEAVTTAEKPEQIPEDQESDLPAQPDTPAQSDKDSEQDYQTFVDQPLPPLEDSGFDNRAHVIQQPIPPANPFITGVTSTPDPVPPHQAVQDAVLPAVTPVTPAPAAPTAEVPEGVSRSWNAQLQHSAQEDTAQEDTDQEDTAQENAARPLLSDAPTDMPEPQPSPAAPIPTPQVDNTTRYQQPTPEQLQQTAQPKGPAVPPIPPVPPFQPSTATSTPQPDEESETDQSTHEPFVMQLPDYLGVDWELDEPSPSTEADDSPIPPVVPVLQAAQTPQAAHISTLPDAPEPVVGADGVPRIGHAASKLPSALTDPYDEKTGTLLPSDGTTPEELGAEPAKKNTGKIVLAVILLLVLILLGALLVWTWIKNNNDETDSASPMANLAEDVNTQTLAGTNNVPEGLDIGSSHAGWVNNTFTSCYVDSQEDDSTLELVYAARRGDDAFTTLCTDTDRKRTLLSIAYHNPESSDSDDFVLLHAWDDAQSNDAQGKVEYSSTDTEKNTKSEYRLDEDTLKIFTTSPATKSIRDSDLVQEVKFDTVWTRES